jgi:uncharacterized protein (TIGR04255 family)
MPFPESPRVVYGKNPLVEVICQFRFPTILRIAAEQPADFQDKIRCEYPLYSLQEPSIELPQLPKQLSAIIEQIGLPKLPGSSTHRFSTSDSQRFISLSQDFLALTESEYERWELFREEIKKAENALQEAYSPAFYSRIGLRYKDVISRRNLGLTDAKWRDLLQPHIVAELGDPEVSDAIVSTQTQSVIKTPEVPGGQVKLIHGLVKSSGTNEELYMIDADFSVERREGLDEPFEILDKFNRIAGRLFRWAITDTLHMAMEPKTI